MKKQTEFILYGIYNISKTEGYASSINMMILLGAHPSHPLKDSPHTRLILQTEINQILTYDMDEQSLKVHHER